MLPRVESIHGREQEDAEICEEKCELHDGNLGILPWVADSLTLFSGGLYLIICPAAVWMIMQ